MFRPVHPQSPFQCIMMISILWNDFRARTGWKGKTQSTLRPYSITHSGHSGFSKFGCPLVSGSCVSARSHPTDWFWTRANLSSLLANKMCRCFLNSFHCSLQPLMPHFHSSSQSLWSQSGSASVIRAPMARAIFTLIASIISFCIAKGSYWTGVVSLLFALAFGIAHRLPNCICIRALIPLPIVTRTRKLINSEYIY